VVAAGGLPEAAGTTKVDIQGRIKAIAAGGAKFRRNEGENASRPEAGSLKKFTRGGQVD
jgi:hypothetical protein